MMTEQKANEIINRYLSFQKNSYMPYLEKEVKRATAFLKTQKLYYSGFGETLKANEWTYNFDNFKTVFVCINNKTYMRRDFCDSIGHYVRVNKNKYYLIKDGICN